MCLMVVGLLAVGCGGETVPEVDSDRTPAAAETASPQGEGGMEMDHAGMDHAETDHAAMGHGDHDMGGLTASGGDGYTESDVHFMQMMIGHHDQAVRMSALSAGRDAGPEVRQLSQRIDISQRDEILFMEEWLRQRDQPVPQAHHLRAMEMPGLVSDEDFERLSEARGQEFDRLFLTFMIQHHLGAIDMVDTLFENPRAAQESDIFRFATDVAADQLDEIHVMERLLADL